MELDPSCAGAHRELGWTLLWDRGAYQEAEEHLRKAIQLEPGNGWAHVYLGTLLGIRADAEAALAEFRLAAEIHPKWTVPLWSMGDIYECVYEDFDSAQAHYERALQLDPEDGEALKNLGRLFKKRGRFDLARECLDRALLLDPDDERVRKLLREIDAAG